MADCKIMVFGKERTTLEMTNAGKSTGHNPWTSIMGGDGMQVQIDNRNSNIVYTGYQFGNYFRLDLRNKEKNLHTTQARIR